MAMPMTPMSQPLITWPLPALKEKGLPFLLAIAIKVVLELTIELLSVLELANVSDTDSVAALDSTAVANGSVVNGDALDNLDTGGRLGVLALLGLLSRTGRTLLKVLGELNLLSVFLLFGSDSLALVVLELLLLLLRELSIILGDELVKALGLLSGALVLALVGGNELRCLLLVSVDLLDTGVLKSIECMTYPLGVESADDKVLKVGTVLAVIVGVLILILVGLLGGLSLALGLAIGLAIGLGILHLVVGLLLSGLEKLLDGSSLSLLLGLGRVAGATVGLLIGVLLVVRSSKKSLQVLVVNLIILILIEARKSTLDEAQGRARNGRDVALAIGLRLLGGVHGSHGDAELQDFLTGGVANDAPATRSELGRAGTSHHIKSVAKARGDELTEAGNSMAAGIKISPGGTSRP
ncbi:unnamed protein product [Fusarium venenatum]|uniref:Uncharacterized protein n=1 Tax=Fusarium venenatum TaxID=56646 RepID=A0A2L2T4U4_9HYPO|nr:uncharacterized protein FVRRES_01330 [Fusarium venenatum]CEI64818.1 unnamed protein product [Fusarium venenatum]